MKKKMIKNLLLVALMAVLCVVVGMTASAETWGDYEYTVLEDGTVEIIKYVGNSTEVEIPAEIDGKSVTKISYEAFIGCDSITGFIVDENSNFFSNDSRGVLFNKDKTELLKYPIANEASSYIVPEGVTTIGEYAFNVSIYLTNITFPETLESIKDAAFVGCIGITEIDIPENVESVGFYAFGGIFFLDKIIIRSIDINLGDGVFCPTDDFYLGGITYEDFLSEFHQLVKTSGMQAAWVEILRKYEVKTDDWPITFGTIYCHADSTAESYAKLYEMEYITTHFYEEEWTYDYDNLVRYRKCIHCDELETEALETTGDSDVEIIEPVDPDTDFTVDVVEDYVVIEETISNNVTTDFEIVKAFDINLKNKDGVHVQPDGTVKVKLPLDWSKDGVYKVYRVNDNGTLTDMNAYRQGSHMVFDTDHFSIYVIVDESEKTDAPVTPDEPQEETKDNFFTRLLDLIKSFFDLIMSWFKK